MSTESTSTNWRALAVGLTMGVVLVASLAIMAYSAVLIVTAIVTFIRTRRSEGFYVIDNEGTRTFKAELTSDTPGWHQMSTGIVQMTKPKDSSFTKLEFECSLPEPQATFVYHRPSEQVCQCKNNCHWDSECECGKCSVYKASVITRDGSEIVLGNLIRHGDGVTRLQVYSEELGSADIVAAKVALVTPQEGEVALLHGLFY